MFLIFNRLWRGCNTSVMCGGQTPVSQELITSSGDNLMKRVLGVVVGILALTGMVWAAQNPTLINGAGASFPNPIYSKWFDTYDQKNSSVRFNYQSVGSGAGIKQASDGTVDFGATDGPMSDEQMKAFKDKRGCDVLHFPTVLGAAVPTYNVKGVSAQLNFTPEALAGIC